MIMMMTMVAAAAVVRFPPVLFTQPFIQVQVEETSKLCVSGLCEGNSPMTGEFPA